jgi:ferrous iron transport protein B
MKIALAGNPNSGKTTLFNSLTGMHQHVGNWPGKTVEKKEGIFSHDGRKIDVIDLPGTYSLTAYSIEEIVARDFVIDEQPDAVINIVDASNLERNLYLTVQLIELGANVILALNMNRYADRKGLKIDDKKLSRLLGIPVVRIEAIDGAGKDDLIRTAISPRKAQAHDRLRYGKEIEEHKGQLKEIIRKQPGIVNPEWVALKLLEKDAQVTEKIRSRVGGRAIIAEAEAVQKHLDEVFGDDVDAVIADARYGFIAGLLKESVKKPSVDRRTMSENIDRIVTSRALGIPIFFLAMYLLFQATFTFSAPLVNLIERGVAWLAVSSSSLMASWHAPEWLISLVENGVFGGVGSVLSFVPIIMIMFFIISLLEDSGYMARAAFIMDRVMHKIGLHGKAFIPFLLGFGCTVPAIMATRTLETKKDRILTMLLAPMMSCGARLPVYLLFTAAFFPKNKALVIFSIYFLGILMAVGMGLIFKRFLFKGTSSPFVMELPPYRLPTLKGSLIHMWERGKQFVVKAGTVIFGAVIVIWLLSSMPFGVEYASEDSAAGMVGKAIAPVFSPLGFGNWQASVSLVFGFVAKEVIIGSMGALYHVGEEGLSAVLTSEFSPLSAFSFMVFVLLYVPCVVVIATMRKETGTWRWPLFTAAYLTALAWVASFVVYQGGLLLGLG